MIRRPPRSTRTDTLFSLHDALPITPAAARHEMTAAYINRVATAVPPHDVHRKFLEYAPGMLAALRMRRLLDRMATRAGLDNRSSVLAPDPAPPRLALDDRLLRAAVPAPPARMARQQHTAPH